MNLYVKCDRCGEVEPAQGAGASFPEAPSNWSKVQVSKANDGKPAIEVLVCGRCSQFVQRAINDALDAPPKAAA